MNSQNYTLRDMDLLAISDLCFEYLNKPRFDFVFLWKNVSHGKANYSKKLIIMPEWAKKYGDTFVIQYWIHELCHLLVPHDGRGGHGPSFKALEVLLCAKFGITFKRTRVYPVLIWQDEKLVWKNTLYFERKLK